MSKMIERVARALYFRRWSPDLWTQAELDDKWNKLRKGERDEYREAARAAIYAMRETTNKMRYAGAEAERPYGSIDAAYVAMIDEALR